MMTFPTVGRLRNLVMPFSWLVGRGGRWRWRIEKGGRGRAGRRRRRSRPARRGRVDPEDLDPAEIALQDLEGVLEVGIEAAAHRWLWPCACRSASAEACLSTHSTHARVLAIAGQPGPIAAVAAAAFALAAGGWAGWGWLAAASDTASRAMTAYSPSIRNSQRRPLPRCLAIARTATAAAATVTQPRTVSFRPGPGSCAAIHPNTA